MPGGILGRLVLDSALDAFITIDSKGIVLDWNRQAESTFGWSKEEALGREMMNLIIPPHLRAAHIGGMRRFLATGEGPILNKRIEISAIRRNGQEFPVELTVIPAKVGEEWLFSSCIRDLTEKKRVENRNLMQNGVSRILFEAVTLESAAPALIATVLNHSSWDAGILWMNKPGLGTLSCVSFGDRPSFPLPVFGAEQRQKLINLGVGVSGRVWATGEAEWIDDLVRGESFPLSQEGTMAGLRSACAFPIYQGSRVVGVIEFLSRGRLERDPEAWGELVFLCRQMTLFLERQGSREELTWIRNLVSLLFARSGGPTALIAAEGGDRFICLEANEAYRTRYSLPKAGVPGKRPDEYLSSPDYSAWLDKARRLMKEGGPILFRVDDPALPGGKHMVERWTGILDDSGRCSHLLYESWVSP